MCLMDEKIFIQTNTHYLSNLETCGILANEAMMTNGETNTTAFMSNKTSQSGEQQGSAKRKRTRKKDRGLARKKSRCSNEKSSDASLQPHKQAAITCDAANHNPFALIARDKPRYYFTDDYLESYPDAIRCCSVCSKNYTIDPDKAGFDQFLLVLKDDDVWSCQKALLSDNPCHYSICKGCRQKKMASQLTKDKTNGRDGTSRRRRKNKVMNDV